LLATRWFATIPLVTNYLDFLAAFDDHVRLSSLGHVTYGHELEDIAKAAWLMAADDQYSAARWAGECVAHGYITHNPPGAADLRPVPSGGYTADELRRFTDWRITPTGRSEADRLRRQRREDLTDAALGGLVSKFTLAQMSESHRRAIMVPLANLRGALDSEQHVAAVGAAKDLAEAACKVVVDRAVAKPASSLPALFTQALAATGRDDAAEQVGKSLAATVQRLAEFRNVAGSGHGRADQPTVTARDARLAGTAACGIALFVLDPRA
jgi:hypothetical protein